MGDGMSNEKLDVTVLMFCYNEQEALPKVIADIRAAFDGKEYSYEILVVDDGSTDKSAAIAQDLSCRVIRLPAHRGAGAACKTGISSSKGAIIAMLDADGTYTAADIPKMLEYFPEFDQVNGARTSEQGTLPFLRTPAKWMVRMFVSLLANKKIPDLQTGLKVFKRDMMLPYLWVIPDKFSHCPLITLAFLCNGRQVKYIPTEYHQRIGGRSKFHPITDTVYVLMSVCRFFIYFYPLRILLPVALVLILFSILKLHCAFDVSKH
jgi:polyisoprenyl-phosphate glycosyltransferase